MRCRYCNIALAPLRSLADGEFCCDEHRHAYQQLPAAAPEVIPTPEPPVAPPEPEISPALRMLRLKFPLRAPADPVTVIAPAEVAAKAPQLPALEEALQLPVEELQTVAEPYPSESNEDPAADRAEEFFESTEEPSQSDESSENDDLSEHALPHPPREIAASWHEASASWQWIRAAWSGAPRDLKLVTVVLPVLVALAVTGSFPKVPIKTVAPAQMAQVEKVVNEHWKNLNETISNRAAVSYADDFRSGLDGWESRSNLTTSWSYDLAGFVRPGPLAIFKPTLDMVDYRFEFLGEIDQRAMGWVFRAEDLNNYYAMKFVIVKPGPLPLVDMVRYAVINGKEGPHVHKPLPMTVRPDMLYRVLMDVRGADFTVIAQGQVVDFWTDHRLQHGGVGFFSNHGERARLRWVEVSHQYDALGRVCAYLAPYGIEGRNGTFN
jgi:hypothetical protein